MEEAWRPDAKNTVSRAEEKNHVPFNGSQMLGYPSLKCEWYEFREFDATMTCVGYVRGRSSTKFVFKDEAGAEYEMFLSDMFDILPLLKEGKLKGRWGFRKAGQNYGITYCNAG